MRLIEREVGHHQPWRIPWSAPNDVPNSVSLLDLNVRLEHIDHARPSSAIAPAASKMSPELSKRAVGGASA
jgi:hypothetical protein